MIDDRHVCGDDCVCPIHGTPLIYSPAGDDHACQDVSCEHGGGMGPGWRPPMFPVLPDGLGALLHSLLAEPEQQPGGPYVHTFREPELVPLLDDDGQPVLDEAGEPVMFVPSRPSYTISEYWEPSPEQAVEMIRKEDEWLLYGQGDTPGQRVARILTDAGWTDAALAAGESEQQ